MTSPWSGGPPDSNLPGTVYGGFPTVQSPQASQPAAGVAEKETGFSGTALPVVCDGHPQRYWQLGRFLGQGAPRSQ